MQPRGMLSKTDLVLLEEALHYLHVPELKDIVQKLALPDSGNKAALIQRIVHFIQTGHILPAPTIPAAARAQKGTMYPVHPNTLMMHGAYKNDLATRLFFQQLIGPHFHFTASGIDWLNARWLAGTPPTYQEFADFWQTEHTLRQTNKPTPKKEWAYITFLQRYLLAHPNAGRDEMMQAWHTQRQQQITIVYALLKMP